MNENFSRFCVISADATNKVLDVKHYKTLEDYNSEIDKMHSAFETRKEANHECKRVARMCNGESLV
ncbi:MAG TPA: hypothetical protein VIK72_19375 [Clostridiaceae bacterium]